MIENEVNRFLMLASCYGLQMAPTSPAAYTHIPLSLIPTRFPATNFRDLIDKTPLHNLLMFKVSKNVQYMRKCLEEVCKIDDFTRKLVEISAKAHSSRFYQDIFLGLTRNDFMFDENCEKFFQVEYNTIAASFVSLGTKIVPFHEHILSNYSSLFEDCPSSVLENNALSNFVKGMKLACDLYGGAKRVLFVVLEDEKNLFDQTFLEVELWGNWKIPVTRASLKQINDYGEVAENGELLYKGLEISLVYFRSGYVPDHYPTSSEWSARELIETSKAIKCPNIDFHISGCKKIQQCLSQDMSSFINCPSELSENTTEIYDFSSISPELEERIRQNPQDWVLKPQREGGGNNTYGPDILPMLEKHEGLKDFILMKMIKCKENDSFMVRQGVLRKMRTVSEVGMFGMILGRGDEILVNEYSGYLVRTKSKESNEGGVAAGYAVIDSASLI